MAYRYDKVLEAIWTGREITRQMVTGEETLPLPPMTDEPNQAAIDAEQAERLRQAAEARKGESR